MPKEVIHAQSTPFMPVVTWDRDTDMRIGFLVNDSTLAEELYGHAAEAIGEAFRALPCPPTDEGYGTAIIEAIARAVPFESLWADLTRSECNHLVSVLRRARNQVFGPDE